MNEQTRSKSVTPYWLLRCPVNGPYIDIEKYTLKLVRVPIHLYIKPFTSFVIGEVDGFRVDMIDPSVGLCGGFGRPLIRATSLLFRVIYNSLDPGLELDVSYAFEPQPRFTQLVGKYFLRP